MEFTSQTTTNVNFRYNLEHEIAFDSLKLFCALPGDDCPHHLNNVIVFQCVSSQPSKQIDKLPNVFYIYHCFSDLNPSLAPFHINNGMYLLQPLT